MINSKKMLALGVIGALGLAACGSDDDASEDTVAETESTDATERPPPPTVRAPAPMARP